MADLFNLWELGGSQRDAVTRGEETREAAEPREPAL